MPEPLFNWLNSRSAGVLVHPTAFPGDQGIGVLDGAVTSFLDRMAAASLRYWQICPLGPTGFGDSPYQCFSAFAGNPYLIDLQALVDQELLKSTDLADLQSLPQAAINFGELYAKKWPLLFKAYDTWRDLGTPELPYGDFEVFCSDQAEWLDGYSFFMALKDHLDGQAWWQWPAELRFLKSARKSRLRRDAQIKRAVQAYSFFQYLFFGQWQLVRAAAAERQIEIIGDAPIFVAADSADVWGNPELFQIDQTTGESLQVAGVPPDYFSADGQLWGNPLYKWSAHHQQGYRWWLSRLKANLAMCDVLRIDHFRAFDTYWSIPADAPTAKTGEWREGPGLPFFNAVLDSLPTCRLIAEDLGDLSASVVTLRDATGLPGMAILQFAFGGDSANLYLPHNLTANSVIYPGTHDNDTSLGWYRAADQTTRDHLNRYLRVSGENVGWDLIRCAYGAVSKMAIVPLQDFFSLGSEARFNSPGQAAGNWQWRFTADQLDRFASESTPYLVELAELTGRWCAPAEA
jgi:4-alpha-glucanotransferase